MADNFPSQSRNFPWNCFDWDYTHLAMPQEEVFCPLAFALMHMVLKMGLEIVLLLTLCCPVPKCHGDTPVNHISKSN